ncbi:MAG: hypothetical protein MUF78_04625 [Candidatus Edwardsbacteria bacterium]|jgi:hypothetical protein|nr:hypothetical protein [Candidatus Edwardsbacteria bacterium]
MAHAYTPGLKVTEKSVVRKDRRLPLKGQVMVKQGDAVASDQVVAKTELPGNVQTVNVAGLLGLLAEDVPSHMLKKIGDPVAKDEAIAISKGFFGLFKSSCKAPVTGTIESISQITGQVILREPPLPVQVRAYIDGTIVQVNENEGVVVEAFGTFVQGIFGIGGEVAGEVLVVAADPAQELTPDLLTPACQGKVVVGGSLVRIAALQKAVEVGAKALVVGGINDADLKAFLGYDIGVAITGTEQKGVTLVVTEGFGQMTMARKTFNLLKSKQGLKASVNGATQIRAGVMRPEVIIPLAGERSTEETHKQDGGMDLGMAIRAIRHPYFGRIGKVTALPHELQKLESESHARILEVEFEDGTKAIVPRANVELIED